MDTANTEALDRADMARLVGGHDAALNDLMERHAPAVFRFLCRMLGNEDDANDLAQDTFVRVYRARESYKPDQKFSTWLFTIAGNLARNQFRWRSRHPTVSLDAESETTEQTLGDTLQSPTSQVYCGSGVVADCAAALWTSLDAAGAALAGSQGEDPRAWDMDPELERIRFLPGAAISMHWVNRPTFQ